MFTLINIDESETLEALSAQFSTNADMFPPEIAIVSREAWAICDKHRRKLESAKVKLEAALHRVQVRAMEGGAE